MAIAELIAQARLTDIPIVNVDSATAEVMAMFPEAAGIDERSLRLEIARLASHEPGVGVKFEAQP